MIESFGPQAIPRLWSGVLAYGDAAAIVADDDVDSRRNLPVTRSRGSTTGLVITHYERAGDIEIGDTALDSPSDAERALSSG
jgi:hypothetical protein